MYFANKILKPWLIIIGVKKIQQMKIEIDIKLTSKEEYEYKLDLLCDCYWPTGWPNGVISHRLAYDN